jgi:hypothetical protein
MTELALTLSDRYKKNHALLGKPVSTLARMAGLGVNDVYAILIPELAKTNLSETIKYAEVGLRYASIVDRNRLREECGQAFIAALSMIIQIVQSGLQSDEHWIKRKAIQLHGSLIDEVAEKQRFIDTLMTERKIELIAEGKANIAKLEAEVIDFEMKEQGVFEVGSSSVVEVV